MNNEQFTFLLSILRGRWDESELSVAREIAAGDDFDWDSLQQIIDVEALAPLLYPIVRDRSIAIASIEKKWRNAYYQNACRNTLLLRELADVLHKLAAAGVDVIVLKGAALAEIVYGDIGTRSMSDLDLLIHPEDLPVTRQVLATLGYAPVFVEMQTGFTEEFRNEEIFYKSAFVEVYIDLHWRLIAPIYYQRTFSTNWFWETCLPTKISKAPAFVLGCEAQVLYLCTHLMVHHGGSSLLWLHDVAAVIFFDRERIDWDRVIAKAKDYNSVLSVQQILLRIARDWNAPIPMEVLDNLRALQPSRSELQTYNWQHQIVAMRLFADLVDVTDWRQRLRIARDTLFPSRAYMQQRYCISHPLLVPFYYPYRLLRGLRRVPS